MNYTTMDRVFAKVTRDLGSDFDEDDIIEWTAEALEFMKTPRSFDEYISFSEVKNYQCDLPKGIHSIIQIARNNSWTGPNSRCGVPGAIKQELITDPCYVQKSVYDASDPCVCPFDDAVWLDCNGQPIVAYDLAYYRPFFDLQGEYFGWRNSSYFRREYTPVRLKTSSFFNTLVCQENNDAYPYNGAEYKDEYNIIERSKLRFSFREGFIAIACNKQALDPTTGYPMIPDSISHLTAIVKYIALKGAEKEYRQNGNL